MRGRARHVLLALGVGLVLWFGFRWLFPNDEAQIRAVLDRIAHAIGSGAEEGEVSRIARAASLRNLLDPQLTVDAGQPFNRMSGRDAIIAAAARLNSTARDLEIRFVDVDIDVADDRASATSRLTAEAYFRDARGERVFDARELEVTFRRLEGDWVVSGVALIRTIEPVTDSSP